MSSAFFPPRDTAPAPAARARPRDRAAAARERAAEAQLVQAAREGDRAALTRLVEQVSAPAYRFSRGFCRDPHDAEDLVQDVLATLLRSLPRFRGESSLSTWVYVVARRACGRLRRRGGRQTVVAPDAPELTGRADPAAGPLRRLERRQLGEALERAIASLPMAQREVLVMRDVEGLSAAEAGEVLGIGERALKSRLHRARLALRERLAPFVSASGVPAPGPRCPDTAHLLSRYLEGELSPSVCARMEEHVRGCESCGDACHSLRSVLGACRAYGERPLDAGVRRQVRQAVRNFLSQGQ